MLCLCKVLESISEEMMYEHFGKETEYPQQHGLTKSKFSHTNLIDASRPGD